MLSLRSTRQFMLLKKAFHPQIAAYFSSSSERFSAVKNVTVIGSGLMGSGIAQVCFVAVFYLGRLHSDFYFIGSSEMMMQMPIIVV